MLKHLLPPSARTRACALFSCVLMMLAPFSVPGQTTYNYSGNANANWSAIVTGPATAGDEVVISADITANRVINLDVPGTVGQLTFEDLVRSHRWQVSGAEVLTFDSGGPGSAVLNLISASPGAGANQEMSLNVPVVLNSNLIVNTSFNGNSGNSTGKFDFDAGINGQGNSITVRGVHQLAFDGGAVTNLSALIFESRAASAINVNLSSTAGFLLHNGLLSNLMTVGSTSNTIVLGGGSSNHLVVQQRGMAAVLMNSSISGAADFVVEGAGLQPKWVRSNDGQGAPNSGRNQVEMRNTTANVFSGNTVVSGAFLNLNSESGNVTKINPAGTLTVSGATVQVDDNSGGATSMAVAGTIIAGGESNLSTRRNNNQNVTFNLGEITRQEGVAVFRYLDGGTIGTQTTLATSSPGVNGILGGWAYLGSSGNNVEDFAGVSSGRIVVPTYTTMVTAGGTGTENFNRDSNANLTLSGSVSGNSLRLRNNIGSGTQVIDTAGNNITLSSGGVLVTQVGAGGAANLRLTGGGTLAGASPNDDLFFYVRNNYVAAETPLIGAGSGALYKSGFGVLSVSAEAAYTGGTYITGGVLEAQGNSLSSGPLTLTNGGQLGQSGTFTRAIGTGAGEVSFGVGGGGFSAQGGPLTVNLGGAGAPLTGSQIGGNLSLNNTWSSTAPVTLVNPIDVAGGVTVSVGANVNPGMGRLQSNGGVAWAELAGGTTGDGALLVYGHSSSSGNANDSGHAGAGMLIVERNLNHTGPVHVVGASLFAGDFSQLANRNTALFAGGQLAGYGSFTAPTGTAEGEWRFDSTTFLNNGGFAAVGGPLTVNVGGSGGTISNIGGIALGNAFSTHTLEFANALSGTGIKVNGPVPVLLSGKISGGSFSVGNNSATAGVLIVSNPTNDFTGAVTVNATIYRAASAAAYGAPAGGNNGGGGTHDLNGFNFSTENFSFGGRGNGPLGISRLINSNTEEAARFGDFAVSNLFGGENYFGGPGHLIQTGNITGSIDNNGTVEWRGTGTFTVMGSMNATLGGADPEFSSSFVGGTVNYDYSLNPGAKLISKGGTGVGGNGYDFNEWGHNLNSVQWNLLGNATSAVVETVAINDDGVFGGTRLTGGASSVRLTTAGQNLSLHLQRIASSDRATLDFATDSSAGGTAIITTDNLNNTAGVLGGWATWNQSDWAVNSVGSGNNDPIAPLAPGSYTDQPDVAQWVGGEHLTNNGAGYSGALAGNLSVHSLRFNSPHVSDIDLGGNTLSLGALAGEESGLLITPAVGANPISISNGVLNATGNNNNLFVHHHGSGLLSIGANFTGTSSVGLVKSGQGSMELTGNSNFSNNLYVYGGSVRVPTVANAGTSQPLGSGGAVMLHNGSRLEIDLASDAATNKTVQLGIGGGVIEANGSGILTLDGSNTNIGGLTFQAAVLRRDDKDVPNLTLTGSGQAVVNGAILLTTPWQATNSHTQQAVVEGFGQLTKQGSGTWTLNGSNYWQGGTIVEEGVLALGHATDTLSNNAPVTVLSQGSLHLGAGVSDHIGTLRLRGGVVSGEAGSVLVPMAVEAESGVIGVSLDGRLTRLTKSTGGTLVLSGANTYQMGTFVEAGTLLVNNSTGSATGSGPVFLGPDTTLGGSGSIAGAVSMASGTLAPGNSPGTLSFGSDLTLGGPVTYLFDLGVNQGGSDSISVAGDFDAGSDLQVVFNLLGDYPAEGTQFTLFTIAGSTTNMGNISFSGLPQTWLEQSSFGQVGSQWIYTAVPEPGFYAALAGMLALLLVLGARHRRRPNS